MNTFINDAHAAIWEAVKDEQAGDIGEALAVSLVEMLNGGNGLPNAEVTPVFAKAVTEAAALTIEQAAGLTDPEDLFAPINTTEVSALAEFMLQLPWGDAETERPNKRLALEVAETFGPDWAQVLYRFAVLVTKLA